MRTFGEAPPPPTLFEKLKTGLARSTGALGESIGGIFTKKKLDAASVEQLEEALIRADLGAGLAKRLAGAVAKGRYDKEVSDADVREILANEITAVLKPIEKPLVVDGAHKPFVVLVAGVNGTGKTTTIGKMAKRLAQDGHKIVLAAGDTFRAAAIEQLQVWGRRTGAEVVSGAAGGDAAGLAFDALAKARQTGADVLLIDTAGRLQNKAGLMAELEKIARVVKKLDASAPHAVLLVLDATTGQNALSQVEAFKSAVPLTGLVMTKLDGTAKGGILVALADKFGLPVHYIGVGEGEDDLQPFDAASFAKALTGSQ
ncbi:MAG TPA: signal recognition particle-docking protein FtsY [Rhizomicrobium sp.]|jgi:fused signal recognition particle receptor|nr:signal recognition particle-docking protein FtsY [Rhizomicrobium sp.]